MQLTIEIPDNLATQLQTIPNLNEFVTKLLTQSLTNPTPQTTDLSQFKGTIQLHKDPLQYQQEMREEWT